MNITGAQGWFLILFPSKVMEVFGEMSDSTSRARTYKMRRKHVFLTDTKEIQKQKKEKVKVKELVMSKGHRKC